MKINNIISNTMFEDVVVENDTKEPVTEDISENSIISTHTEGAEEFPLAPIVNNYTSSSIHSNENGYINKMLIIKSGTYNDMYRRPYTLETTPANIDNLANVLMETNTRPQSTNMTTLNDMIKLEPVPTESISITNGWGTPRFRFILEYIVQNGHMQRVYVYQGYSEHGEESISGLIDPDMKWYINSVTIMNRSVMYGGSGTSDVIVNNSNILRSEINRINSDTTLWAMRPKDIFIGENTYLHLNNMVTSDISEPVKVFNSVAAISNRPKAADRSNNIPVRYISDIIKAFNAGRSMASIGSDIVDTFNTAAGMMDDYNLTTDPFLKLLGEIATSKNNVPLIVESVFTLSDLHNIDPTLSNKVEYIRRSSAVVTDNDNLFKPHTRGETEDWMVINTETLIANILIDVIPTLLSECMLSRIAFTIAPGLDGKAVFMPITANSLFNTDVTKLVELFNIKFTNEIYPYITRSSMLNVVLKINASLFGECRVSVSVNGNPEVEYTSPAFSDSLYIPIITGDEDKYKGMVHSFNEVFELVENISE